ncbi:BatD family protein [Cellulophaga sp. 20_2_10]|uniref:BatD family protein n=1 Tax=Cellulophaga sp. 20_2_10 TaxID=2942476 RepID=UPI00201B3276|nr:BatD family protein [Cellulophaga sp. 20_2_10]MCL5247794.1 BatD family protein [Cellulophaga sp. 20_2_10]
MKRITLLLLIFCSLNAIGQKKLEIEIDNPEPRVGQSVTFSINVDFLTDYFKKELGKNVDFTRSTSIFGMQSDDFERVIIFEKAKKYEIGPFDFEFNGKKYTTEIIEVNVLPKLPMENGLWLRITESDSQQYLILEQLISNESNKTDNENGGYSQTIGGVKPEGKEFAELNEKLTKGIELSNYSSATNTMKAEDAELFDVGFSYSIIKYKIKFEKDFSEEYIISETDFNNLPEKYDIGKIKVKK